MRTLRLPDRRCHHARDASRRDVLLQQLRARGWGDDFRPSGETPEIARQAAAIGAKVLWLQEGVHSDEAERIAKEAGMTFVSDTCMGHTHWDLFHEHDRDTAEGP